MNGNGILISMNSWRQILSWQVEEEFQVVSPGDLPLNFPSGTSFLFEIQTTYARLVKKFGRPTLPYGDVEKTDREWVVYLPIIGKYFTIYNYKNGQNYLGRRGTPVTRITNWHIGGESGYSNEIHQILDTL